MTLEELREMKHKTEEEIAVIVRAFFAKTGITIKYINVEDLHGTAHPVVMKLEDI